MEQQQIEAIESYIKTDNEHFNEFTLNILCEVLQQGKFENPELPLKLFSDSIEIFTEQHEHPVKAVQLFAEELDKQQLTPPQKLFVYGWVCKYLRDSTFEGIDLTPVKNLLNTKKKELDKETQPVKPLVKNIRESLKDLVQRELQQLPETLKGLEPVQRLNILCKLMPFVLPKVETIDSTQGEPGSFY